MADQNSLEFLQGPSSPVTGSGAPTPVAPAAPPPESAAPLSSKDFLTGSTAITPAGGAKLHARALSRGALSPEEEAMGAGGAVAAGVPFGSWWDEFAASVAGLGGLVSGQGFEKTYDKAHSYINRVQAVYDSEHPTDSTLRTMAGAGISMAAGGSVLKGMQGAAEGTSLLGDISLTLGRMPLYGRSAVGGLFGGIAGATQGFGEGGSYNERKRNALVGGTMGIVMGSIFPPVGAIPEGTLTRPFLSADAFATRYARQALGRDSITKDQAIDVIRKPGRALIDVGDESMVQAGEQAALEGEGRRLGANLYYNERLQGREARMAQIVDDLVSDQSMYDTLDSLMQGRAVSARPLYEKAFAAAESQAPFVQRLTAQFDEASAKAAQSFTAVLDAERAITQAHARLSRAGDNVYAVSGANQELKAAEEKLAQAEEAHKIAMSEKADVRLALAQAQDDLKHGRQAGYWTPQIQRILDNSDARIGLNEGIRILKNEAVANRTVFKPEEYAIKGFNNEGEPIIGTTVNFRLLDAIKRGFDGMLSKYPLDHSGKPILDELGRSILGLKKSLVEEMDRIGPSEYAAARKAWEGPSRMITAVYRGRDFFSEDPEAIEKYVETLTPAEHDAYKIGVARAINDIVTSGANGAINAAKKISGSTAVKNKLRAALKSDDAVDKLVELAEFEVKSQQRAGGVLGGSPTARRAEGAKQFEELSPVIDDFVAGARSGLTGIAGSVRTQFGRMVSHWMSERLKGMSSSRRAALGRLLFSTSEADNLKAIEMIYEAGKTPKGPKLFLPTGSVPAASAAAGLFGEHADETDPRR